MRNDERMAAPPMPQPVPGYTVPTDIVVLPSGGKFYPQGHPWHNKTEVEVKYMTAKEEDILVTPSYMSRGITLDKLIESIAVDNIVAETLLEGDKNAIIVNARKNAYGAEYVVALNCPS